MYVWFARLSLDQRNIHFRLSISQSAEVKFLRNLKFKQQNKIFLFGHIKGWKVTEFSRAVELQKTNEMPKVMLDGSGSSKEEIRIRFLI
jgi:hypothetical protein